MSKQYIRSSGLSFKKRYTLNIFSIDNSNYRLKSTLSERILELNDRNKYSNINWEVLARTKNMAVFLQYEKTRDFKIKPETSFK